MTFRPLKRVGGTVRKRTVIFHGALPPPHNGMTLLTEQLLSSGLKSRFRLIHVNTWDHRGIGSVGVLDLRNIALALFHGWQFVRRLVWYRPDLVYVQIARNRLGILRDLQFLLAARLARIKVVLHFQSRGFWEFVAAEPRWMRWLVAVACPRGTEVIVLGESLREDFGPLIDPALVHVVQNGAADLGAGPPAGERGPIVAFMATLMAEKGIFDLLNAAARLARAHPDARFVVAGTWYRTEDAKYAEKLAWDEGLGDRVVYVGPLSGKEKVSFMRSASMLALPSSFPFESQPLVVFDAMSAGTPVIVSRIGTTTEVIRDGVDGFLIDQQDIDGLTSRIDELLCSPDLRTRIGREARARYERDFTVEAFARRVGDVWTGALDDVPGVLRTV